MTYDLILPDTVLISLVLVAGHPQSRNEQSQRIRGYCNDCCRVHKGQATIRHESIDTAVSLLQACHTTHTELAPRFYQTLRFQARPSFVANHFQECLLPFVKPAIQELRLMDYPYLRCYGEKAEKNGIEAAVKGLVGLRVLYWHGLDGSADANTKGTRWKPQELRKLAAVLKSSAQLRKAFYNPAAVRRHSSVRLTSVNGTARLNACSSLGTQAPY